jgi:chemotaxis protein MotA
MDITTPIGLFGAVALVFVAILIEGGNPVAFINAPASLMVFGGLTCTMMLAYPMEQLKDAIGIIRQLFFMGKLDAVSTINTLVDMCTLVRRDGLLALDAVVRNLEDPFLAKGVQFVVDGMEPELTKEILNLDLSSKRHRHHQARGILDMCAAIAPGFALVGTLVGLVSMLANLDPSTVGHKMALALICTLYGCFVANAIFMPASKNLEFKSEHELLVNEIMVEGLLGIQAGENPRHLEDRLKAFLPMRHRDKAGGGRGSAAIGEAA